MTSDQGQAPIPFAGVRVFAALFVIVLAGWAYFLYLSSGNYDFAGNRLSESESQRRKEATEKNECHYSSEHQPRKVECSGLNTSENEELNRLLSSSRYSGASEEELLGQARTLADNQIYWRDFEPAMGGGGEYFDGMVVAAAISAFCLGVGLLVVVVTVPIYLFSSNKDRARKAGGLAKSAFGFIVAVGTTVAGAFAIK